MLCHLQLISSGFTVFKQFQNVTLKLQRPVQYHPLVSNIAKHRCCQLQFLSASIAQPSQTLLTVLQPHCLTACRQTAMSAVAKHRHICWLGDQFTAHYCNWNIFLIWQITVWSVFRWNMNVEQTREVPHAAHDSMFAITEQLQLPHTAVCRAVKISYQLSKQVDLLVWVLFMWYQKMKASCMVVFRDE